MDAFWLIPFGIIAILFLIILYAGIKGRPLKPSDPHVLVDKPSTGPDIDESVKSRDWSTRPVGSFLDWFYGRK